MSVKARFVHTNLVARDWKRLAAFYERVFGCVRVPPERNLSGEWLERATRISGAQIQGIHLRLPGSGNEKGPTLEIFQYNHAQPSQEPALNRPGFAHIAFAVEDVAAATDAVIATGGSVVGDHVTVEIPAAGIITFVYAADPEGNVIELQQWAPS
ncbi:VOC family protein [Thermodesulfobacteriota bacterium]